MLATAAIALPCNLIFEVAAVWTAAKFDCRIKRLLVTLVDLLFSILQAIFGLVYVLMFGTQGCLEPYLAAGVGNWFNQLDIEIIFAI